MNKSNISFVFETLNLLYPNSTTELNYSTDFQLLVAVILSAQTTDKQVNKVTSKLFEIVSVPNDVLLLWNKKLEKMISSVNFFRNKAKHIYETSSILSKNPEILAPDLINLQKLPWVWEKTAKVVAHVLFWMNVVAVDTHVHRVCNRLWIVSTKKPLETSKLLEKVIPNSYKGMAHHGLILFWRYHCKARKPMCSTCPFVDICKRYHVEN